MIIEKRSRVLSSFRTAAMVLISLCIGFVVGLLILEAILRFLPVRENMLPGEVITRENPIIRYKKSQNLVFSIGADFSLVNTVRTNNYGFVSDTDYYPNLDSPLLAVIGDSFVRAAHVPFKKSISGRLGLAALGAGRVYSFGASGAPLSQYLAYAEYVRKTFRPDGAVFVIVGNDFSESLLRYNTLPGFHYFVSDGQGGYALELQEYRPNHVTWLHALGHKLGLGDWALVRYVRANFPAFKQSLVALFSVEKNGELYVGQTIAAFDEERLRLSKDAVDVFLNRISNGVGLPIERIAFVVDGMRPHLYDTKRLALAKGSFFDIMRQYFIRRARDMGFEVVDLQPIFSEHYRANGEPFEFPTDGHWNSLGHGLAAEHVEGTDVFKRVFRIEE